MSRFARTALARIETMLTSVRGPGAPLRAELRLARDFQQEDDEIVFLRDDGIPHTVRVQVGAAYLGVNTAYYDRRDLGDGLVLAGFDSVRHGAMRRSATGPFVADLRAAFAEAPDAFEPNAGPGIGTHPRLPDLVAVARAATAGMDVAISLNPDGPSADGEDTLAFTDAEGARLPVEARTRPGGYLIRDRGTGARIGTFDAVGGARAAEDALRGALAPDVAPVPGR